jgi:hypothetical protein
MYDLEVYPVHDLEGKPELEAELEAEASRAMAEARILCVVGARHSGFRRIIVSSPLSLMLTLISLLPYYYYHRIQYANGGVLCHRAKCGAVTGMR